MTLFELMPHGHQDSSLFGSSGASLHTKAFAVDGEEDSSVRSTSIRAR